ncbi:hypothetical protein AHAS_Ahas10G0155500 [Arachis hypogaea]
MLPIDSSLYHEESDLTEWKTLLSGETTMHRELGGQEIYTQALADRTEVIVKHAFIREDDDECHGSSHPSGIACLATSRSEHSRESGLRWWRNLALLMKDGYKTCTREGTVGPQHTYEKSSLPDFAQPQVEADFESAKGDPVMTTNLKQFERSAAENYTRAIFYLFVPIPDRACAMRVVDSKDNGSYFIYTISRYGTPRRIGVLL